MTGRRYTRKDTHDMRHFPDYVSRTAKRNMSEAERQKLKQRMYSVITLAEGMYKDAYEMTFIADGEQTGDRDFFWNREMKNFSEKHKSATKITGKYDYETLHPLRHMGKYLMELKNPNTTYERKIVIKSRCGDIMTIAVQMCFDAQVLLRQRLD